MPTRRDVLIAGGAAALAPLEARFAAAASDRPLLVSVMTCPRPGGVSYLDGTLAAVDADLAHRPRLLVCDGPEPRKPEGWFAALVPARRRAARGLPDNRVPGWAAIWVAFSMGADLLFLEDDVRPLTPGAFAKMAAHQVAPGAAFTSFYHRDRKPGIHDAAVFNMSQAVLLPSATVADLWQDRDDPATDQVVGVDLAIAILGRGRRWRFEQTAPLVEHVGKYSAAMPGRVWAP